eukprot:6449987-Amphidinium_carterae.1
MAGQLGNCDTVVTVVGRWPSSVSRCCGEATARFCCKKSRLEDRWHRGVYLGPCLRTSDSL